jgi:hypothetical protein
MAEPPLTYDFRQHAPGVVHPALDKPFLRNWINGRGAYANRQYVRYPAYAPFKIDADPEPIATTSMKIETVTQHKCAGPAPYVGRPFCYWWWVGIDDLGRTIAAEETTLQYLVSEWEWMMYNDE